MKPIRVLVAVKASPFARVIEHLFHRSDMEIVGHLSNADSLPEQAGRLLPDVIVANLRMLGKQRWETIAKVKRSSPDSRLVLICPDGIFAREANECGADAYVEEEAVVSRLLSEIVG